MLSIINVRKAKGDDIPRLLELWVELVKHHERKCGYDSELFRHKSNSLSLYRKFLEKRVRARNARVFVAEIEGRIVGHMIVNGRVLRSPIYLHDTEAYIDEIMVDEKYRGKGVGTALIKAAEEWAKNKNLFSMGLFVSTKNKNAFSLYKKLGFEEHHVKMSKILK